MALFKLGRIGAAQAMFERLEELTPMDGILGYHNKATSALFEEARQLLAEADSQTDPQDPPADER